MNTIPPSPSSTPGPRPGMDRRHFIGALGAMAAAPSLTFADNPAQEVHLLAMGDWGASPAMKKPADTLAVRLLQDHVAHALAGYAGEMATAGQKLTGVLALGDNFYGPLSGPEDKRFKERFEDLYPADKLGVPFYFVIGNHDYEDHETKNWQHEIAYAAAHPQGRWTWPATAGLTWYRKDLPEGQPGGQTLLTLIGLDTNTDKVKGQRWVDQTDFLRDQLDDAKHSHWRIVMAHHPMWTDGAHYDLKTDGDPHLYPKIRETILPLLDSTVFYVAAHDHNLQSIRHHQHPNTHFFVSGAGGGDFLKLENKDQKKHHVGDYDNEFHYNTGFLHLSFTTTEARAQFIAVDGETWKPIGSETRVTKT